VVCDRDVQTLIRGSLDSRGFFLSLFFSLSLSLSLSLFGCVRKLYPSTLGYYSIFIVYQT